MSNSLFIVDAFTSSAFSGNPAGVCLIASERSDSWRQAVAAELNLSETAFVSPTDVKNQFHLRWFTPKVEVALCGHATLAAAHVLWTTKFVAKNSPIIFTTELSGNLQASWIPTPRSRKTGSIRLDFPAQECHEWAPPMELLVALGVQPKAVYRNAADVLIELDDERDVLDVTPDFAALALVKNLRGVIITASADPDNGSEYDFVSRFLAPAVGIDEDPVTGSAHCALGPYWMLRLGKSNLIGRQLSKRGGLVQVEVAKNGVALTGSAVTVVEGSLLAEDYV